MEIVTTQEKDSLARVPEDSRENIVRVSGVLLDGIYIYLSNVCEKVTKKLQLIYNFIGY